MRKNCSEFHRKHPEVWQLFVRFTFDRVSHGFKHYSADAIMHRVRWETSGGDSERSGDGFKINDHFVTFYARRFARLYPEHEEFFAFRVQKSETRIAV